uniref:R2D2 n=1 Tax=Phaedon cochleariae TaxID=80249 RepID=A0A894K120_PHACE|nr:R2D2 [Phaedon cochleariae]
MSKITKTPAMVLQELATQKGFGPPTYEIIFSKSGTHENRFDYKVRVAGVEAMGIGTSKQISKHEAAHNALRMLEEMGIYNPAEMPLQEFKKVPAASSSVPHSPIMVAPAPNSIAPLKDLCLDNKINDPTFILISDVGPPHQREFTYECRIDSIRTVATGSTKKMAKQLAAQEMMEKIKDVLPELAQSCPRQTEEKAICDSNIVEEVHTEYNDLFGQIVFDKSVKVEDYPYAIKKLMEKFERTISDFEQDLLEETEESLQRILDKLELKYFKYKLQDDPVAMTITLSTDTPFTTMAVADDEATATAKALSTVFQIINLYTRL